MRLLKVFKRQFLPKKSMQKNVEKSFNETKPKTMIERTFTKDEDTFMFI